MMDSFCHWLPRSSWNCRSERSPQNRRGDPGSASTLGPAAASASTPGPAAAWARTWIASQPLKVQRQLHPRFAEHLQEEIDRCEKFTRRSEEFDAYEEFTRRSEEFTRRDRRLGQQRSSLGPASAQPLAQEPAASSSIVAESPDQALELRFEKLRKALIADKIVVSKAARVSWNGGMHV